MKPLSDLEKAIVKALYNPTPSPFAFDISVKNVPTISAIHKRLQHQFAALTEPQVYNACATLETRGLIVKTRKAEAPTLTGGKDLIRELTEKGKAQAIALNTPPPPSDTPAP